MTIQKSLFPNEEAIANELIAYVGGRAKALRIKTGAASYESFAFDHELPRAQY